MEHFNTLTQHATALSKSSMGLVGELTKMASSISSFQGEQQKNILELFKLVADIQNPTVSMEDRFKKIHESVDKIHDSYKATTQVLTPSILTSEPSQETTPTEIPPAGGRKSRRNSKRKTRKQRRS